MEDRMEIIKNWIEQRLYALRPSKGLQTNDDYRYRLKIIYSEEEYKRHRDQFEAGVSNYGIMSFDIENAIKKDSTVDRGVIIIARNVTGMVVAFEMRAAQYREAAKKGTNPLDSLPATFVALLKTGRIVKIGITVANL